MSIAKQVVLHLGFHKTASTSIQEFLGAHIEMLAAHHYCYPNFKMRGVNYYNHTVPIMGLFLQDSQPFAEYIRRGWNPSEVNAQFASYLDQCLASNQQILISGEGIPLLSQDELLSFKQKLESAGFKIRVIVFLREPVSLISSVVQQQVKGERDIETIIQTFNPNRESEKIKKLQSVFPAIEFHTFDHAIAAEDGPVGYFMRLLNIQPTNNLTNLKINESSSAESIRLLSYVNKKAPFFLHNRINFIRTDGDVIPLLGIGEDKFQLLRQEMHPIFNELIQERARIEALTGVKFSEGHNTLDAYPTVFQWQPAAISALIQAIPKMGIGMQYRVYDYFYELFLNGSITWDDFSTIGSAIRSHLIGPS